MPMSAIKNQPFSQNGDMAQRALKPIGKVKRKTIFAELRRQREVVFIELPFDDPLINLVIA